MSASLDFLLPLTLVFTAAVTLALLTGRWGVPPVLAYLATGALLGPAGLGLVDERGATGALAEVGVVLLLFTVGLDFSLRELGRSWRATVVGGLLQVLLTIALAVAFALVLDRAWRTGIVWGFCAALSSTAIVIRLLQDRGEIRAAHGRVTLGVLVFQDLCVVPMMLSLPLLAGRDGGVAALPAMLLQAAVIVLGTLILARYVVPPLFHRIARARNREVFLLAVLATAGAVAYATASAGLSVALGAFLAGMVLADAGYGHQALADVLPLRSAMATLFFVALGMLFEPAAIVADPAGTVGLFVLLLSGKFVAATGAALLLRVPLRVAALTGAALAQVGEFSFVLAGNAVNLGMIGPDEHRSFVAASVLSMATAPLFVALSPRLLAGSRLLAPLERLLDVRPRPERGETELAGHVVVCGLGVGGKAVVDAVERAGLSVVLVELNPDTVAAQRAIGRDVVYGDSTSPEVLEHAGIARSRGLIVTVSDPEAAHRTAEVARRHWPFVPVVLRMRWTSDEEAERGPGVTVVTEETAGAMAIARAALEATGARAGEEVVRNLRAPSGGSASDHGPAQE